MTYELVFLKIICTVYFNRTVSLSAVRVSLFKPAISKPDVPHLCTIFPTVVAESVISVKQSNLLPGIAPPEKINGWPQGHQFKNCHILPSCIVTGPDQSMKSMTININ